MEVSTGNRNFGFTWTDQAKELIKGLVNLDSHKKTHKEIFFGQLYSMWMNNGLQTITDALAADQFNVQKDYIKHVIFLSLPAEEQEEMKIEESIYNI